jgi:hypothetical protein
MDSPKRQASLRRGDSLKNKSPATKEKVVPPSPTSAKRHQSTNKFTAKKYSKVAKNVL